MAIEDFVRFGCNCTSLRQAARHVTRFYDACFAEIGLRGTQYAILNVLAICGPLKMLELAEVLVLDRATIGHNLRPMARDGWITITVGETDRREREVAISETGSALEARARPLWEAAQAEFERQFGSGEAQSMRQLMNRIVDLGLPVPGP